MVRVCDRLLGTVLSSSAKFLWYSLVQVHALVPHCMVQSVPFDHLVQRGMQNAECRLAKSVIHPSQCGTYTHLSVPLFCLPLLLLFLLLLTRCSDVALHALMCGAVQHYQHYHPTLGNQLRNALNPEFPFTSSMKAFLAGHAVSVNPIDL